MAETLNITTLGGLIVKIGEAPASSFVSRKAEALLVYLACNRRSHPRELLFNLLWDDLPQERAMGNLRTILSNLQQQLGPYLVVNRTSVALNPESAWWLDVAEIENAIAESKRIEARDGSLSAAVVESLEKAMVLYRGDFLAGFQVRNCREFEGWMSLQQERLRGLATSTLHKLIDYCLDHLAHDAGISHASQLLSLDSYDESAHRKMMLLLTRADRRSAALAQFESCRSILRDKLDIEPEEETVALYQAIQDGKVSVVPAKLMTSAP